VVSRAEQPELAAAEPQVERWELAAVGPLATGATGAGRAGGVVVGFFGGSCAVAIDCNAIMITTNIAAKPLANLVMIFLPRLSTNRRLEN